jgi:hypothetical protein
LLHAQTFGIGSTPWRSLGAAVGACGAGMLLAANTGGLLIGQSALGQYILFDGERLLGTGGGGACGRFERHYGPLLLLQSIALDYASSDWRFLQEFSTRRNIYEQ